MSNLTDRIVELSEYCLRNGVRDETYHKAMELFLEHAELYKRRYGSVKHLTGDAYYEALKARYDYAEQKTKDFIDSQMVKKDGNN